MLAGRESLQLRDLPKGLLLGLPVLVVAGQALATSLPGPGPAKGAAAIVTFTVSMLAVGIFEEGVFRGLLLDRLASRGLSAGGVWPAVLGSSIVCGLAHGVNAWRMGVAASAVQICHAVLIGLFFAAVRLHAALDWCCYLW